MNLSTQWQNVNNKLNKCLSLTTHILHKEGAYTPLEYIQSSGTQYIVTDYTPNSETTIELQYRLTSGNNSQGLLSAYSTWADNSYLLYTYNGVNWTFGGKKIAAPADISTIYTLNLYKGRIIRNGTTVTDVTTGTFTNINCPIWLFKAASNQYPAYYKLYYFKIWQNNELVRNFIPVKDESNIVCLYDTVTKEFFYNSGTGTFIAGPEI